LCFIKTFIANNNNNNNNNNYYYYNNNNYYYYNNNNNYYYYNLPKGEGEETFLALENSPSSHPSPPPPAKKWSFCTP